MYMKQEKTIYVDGKKFKATRLSPNFKGIFDQTCEECAFGYACPPDDQYGYFKNCDLVKCIEHEKNEGNTNVWIEDND